MEISQYYRETEIADIYERNINTVYKVCFLYLKQHSMDLEDAVQTTFFKLLQSKKVFDSHEHEKAWLIVTASNICKNMLKNWWWKRRITLVDDENAFSYTDQTKDETLEKVMSLPKEYKICLYLHYYEGYTGVELAKIFNKKESVIWGYLHRGRKMLAEILKEDINNE